MFSDTVRGWNSEVPARPAIVRWLSSKGIRAILFANLYVTSHLDLVRGEQGPGDSHRESVHLTRVARFSRRQKTPPRGGGHQKSVGFGRCSVMQCGNPCSHSGAGAKCFAEMFGAPPYNGRGCKRYSGQGVAPKKLCLGQESTATLSYI